MAKRRAVGDIFSSDSSQDEDGKLSGLSDSDDLNDEEKRRLAQMTEIEREEELFKRAEKQEAIRAREAVRKKLNENKSLGSTKKPISRVFSSESSSGSDDESGDDYTPQPTESRKAALKKKNQRLASQLNAQVAKRQQLKAKEEQQRRMHVADVFGSDNEGETGSELKGVSSSSAEQRKARKESLLSSSSSGSDDRLSSSSISSSEKETRPKSEESPKKKLLSKRDRKRNSRRLRSSDEEDRTGRSSDEDPMTKEISQFSDIAKIQLSRAYLEKWCHMPFFDKVANGCFVRVNIGTNPESGGPMYRCAYVIDVVESAKVYELGGTRTNKALNLKIGQSERVFRLPFMSNTPITAEEFNSWYRRTKDEGVSMMTMQHVENKRQDIRDAFDFRVQDSKALEAILKSKRRFQARPSNYAVRKAELTKQIEVAESNQDLVEMRRLEDELKELEEEAERLDRRRSADVKKINFINQRNRRMNQDLAEEAARLEDEESAKLFDGEGGDPFNRLATRPSLLTKGVKDALARRKQQEGAPQVTPTPSTPVPSPAAKPTFVPPAPKPRPLIVNTQSKETLHGIHDFDIGIELCLDQTTGDSATPASTGMPSSLTTPDCRLELSSSGGLRRSLNLDDYKKKRGLI